MDRSVQGRRRRRVDLLYSILSGDDATERSCRDIPEEQCSSLPRNYVLNVLNGAASKVAELVGSAKLVLPWLLGSIGAPAAVIGLILPLRQAGALLPQLLISGMIRSFPIRKKVWVGAAVFQSVMLAGMVLAVFLLDSLPAGLCVVTCLMFFSVARGVGSIAFQDITGKTIPKGKRGSLLASRTLIGGLLTIGVGLFLKLQDSGHDDFIQPVLLLCLAGVLWLAAAFAFALVEEAPGATEGGRTIISEVGEGFRFLKGESWYRQFLLVRVCFLSIELAGPFYVIFSKDFFSGNSGILGVIVIASGLAATLSSPFWGRYADLSSRRVMMAGGAIGAVAGIAVLGLGLLAESLRSGWLLPLPFILLGFAEAGVLLGRKTYLIDKVDAERRPTFVAFANSLTGGMALLFGSLGLIAQSYGIRVLVLLLVIMALVGSILCSRLPETGDHPQ